MRTHDCREARVSRGSRRGSPETGLHPASEATLDFTTPHRLPVGIFLWRAFQPAWKRVCPRNADIWLFIEQSMAFARRRFQVPLDITGSSLKERNTVTVGVCRGGSRTSWIQNPQMLTSHEKRSMSPIPQPQIRPTSDRVVRLLKKIGTKVDSQTSDRGCWRVRCRCSVVFKLLGNVCVSQVLHQ